VRDLLGAINEFVVSTSFYDVILTTCFALSLLALVSLALEFLRLRKRYAQAEADLFERTVGTQSRNWTNTAQSLEQKAKEPGEVARSTAMTYLHMLDEAADAYMKGSQWQDALRVTQQLLSESCHAIAKPGITESVFRAIADLIELRLTTYPDLSIAASEATENALRFLIDLDTTLWITDQSVRVTQLRDLIAETRAAIEAPPPPPGKHKGDDKPKVEAKRLTAERVEVKKLTAGPPLRPVPISSKPQTPSSSAYAPEGSE
jgi:hypothetical protein